MQNKADKIFFILKSLIDNFKNLQWVLCTKNDYMILLVMSLPKIPIVENSSLLNSSLTQAGDNCTTNELLPITYLASGLLGDFIHQLSIVNEKYRITVRKGIIYMTESLGSFQWGLARTFEYIKPFLLKQNYIYDLRIHDGSTCDINLSIWRYDHHNIYSWHMIFKRHYDVSWSDTPWFCTQGISKYKNTVFISTSPKRWVTGFNYIKLIIILGPDIRFLASEKSNYYHFVSLTGIEIPLVLAPSFTEMVDAIQGCSLFVSTLSTPLAIADALHKKRLALLEWNMNDGYIAANTNPSFITPISNLNLIHL